MTPRNLTNIFRPYRAASLLPPLLVAAPFAGYPAEAAPDRQRLGAAIEARMAQDDVPGVVVVLLDAGAAVWTRAFGLADPVTGRPMTDDTPFRVESLSKPVAAWGAMRLAETGRLDLDAPATDCLHRWRPPQGTPVFTARDLLSHTAGLRLGDFAVRYPPGAARPDLPVHLAEDFRMLTAPGAGFAYSDTGFNVLELMIEDCAGEDFATFMARKIFAPLGMQTATYDWPGPEMPMGHNLHGRPVAPYGYPGRGSGELFATAKDIALFAGASMNRDGQTALSAEGLTALHRPITPIGGLFRLAADGYALGHFTETLSDGRQAVWHDGQGYGWMTHLHMVPEAGDAIVILANSQRAWPLIAETLRVWSEGIRVAPVGMSRVLWAERIARGAIAVLFVLSILAFAAAWRHRSRTRTRLAILALAGLTLIAWPVWAALQDYPFIFSILPGHWPWLAFASALAGTGLTMVSLAPERQP